MINMLLGLMALLLGVAVSVGGMLEECDVSKHRRCRYAVLEELDKQSQAQSTHELEFHCRRLRENLNCLVLQVTQCSTPNRSGELILRAWKHMQKICDTFGGWWSYECFHLDQTKKCEKIFALRESGVTEATCREYDRFRHCIGDVVKKYCDAEDVLSAGNYLLEKAEDMVWTCPHGVIQAKSPVVDKGFVGLTRSEKPLVGQEQQPHATFARAPFSTKRSSKLETAHRIRAEESHLRGVYSSALTADSPFVTGCNARATEEMRGCLDRHQYERDQALGSRDSEDRLRKTCCATWNYRKCVQNAVRVHCYDTRQVDVQAANDVIPHDRDFLCREHWIYTCNGTPNISPKSFLAALFLALSTYLVFTKWQF